MGVRFGVLFILVLGIGWVVDTNARSFLISDLSVTLVNNQKPGPVTVIFEADLRNEKVCDLCEQFAAQAIYYLGENKTQGEIIETLHEACSRLHTFQHECVTLVDYYSPLLFVEVALVIPKKICRKVNLCEKRMLIPSHQNQDSCELCHRALAEVLIKLKDPDTQLEIVETLLKGCDKVDNYKKECKKLVFEYVPLILINAEDFLETKDLCTAVHVCKADHQEEASLAEI